MKRNLVISTKVTPEEKAEFTMIARRYGISLSEWVYSILSMNKDGYEKVGMKRTHDEMSKKVLKKNITYRNLRGSQM